MPNMEPVAIGWWNTSLSPPKGSGPLATDRAFAIQIIEDLLDAGLDLLGVCEVAFDDIKAIEDRFGVKGFGVIYAQDAAGHSKFDMALIYRLSRITCNALKPWTSVFGKLTFRVSYPVEIIINGEPIHLVMSHWPGRRFYSEESKNRNRIAIDMRGKIEGLLSSGSKNIIIMGDFNDEPFNGNISDILLALRDRSSAASSPELFYNPFWNFVGSRPLHNISQATASRSGTYYYKTDHTACWWTFDQIIFSSSFLGNGAWHLEESMTSLYEPKILIDRLKKKGRFDHLPILAGILRV